VKTLLILGAGTAGTMMANHLRRKLPKSAWRIRIIDRNPDHYYQPGFLFMPFGIYSEKDVIKPKRRFVPRGVEYIEAAISRIDADSNRVLLSDGTSAAYDLLIIATGVSPAPDQVEGMLNGSWRKDVHEFYTFDGAVALSERLVSSRVRHHS
jgi:sulfide:quinone oxidoreductase